MKNKHRKAPSAIGKLDAMAIRAEEYASYLTRRNRPAQVTLERIANLAEKAIKYEYKLFNSKGVEYNDTRKDRQDGQERQRQKVLDRIWEAYRVVQENEIMHPGNKGKDESWNGAKQDTKTKKWVSDPVYHYGDHFEYVVSDEMHGYKAQGRTKVTNLDSYDGNEGYGGEE